MSTSESDRPERRGGRSGKRGRSAFGYHHGDLRRALIAAGRELVARDGPAALSLREAARLAGVSHNAPYRHFENREALLAAMAAAGFADLRDALLRAAAEAPPERRLEELGKAYLSFALNHRADFLLMFGSVLPIGQHPELKETAASAFDALRQTVADPLRPAPGQEQRAIRAWALAHGLAHLVADGQLTLEAAIEALEA
ncbi:TetR/AcrR family transcriptional regulator [Microvirga sp. TS319]|uniref:TetR/AcrR family transcriptional regulator n=1 Tax=Microvirga sp. TS319 TaxID=3241165 RepID=UPI00351A86B9